MNRRFSALFIFGLVSFSAPAFAADPPPTVTWPQPGVPSSNDMSQDVTPKDDAPRETPPPPPSAVPAPPADGSQQASPPPTTRFDAGSGQWVYTSQYGWVWAPYDDNYIYYAPSGVAYTYLYYPSFGWRWVLSPWVRGWGPRPYWGRLGPVHYGWYARPHIYARPWRGHVGFYGYGGGHWGGRWGGGGHWGGHGGGHWGGQGGGHGGHR